MAILSSGQLFLFGFCSLLIETINHFIHYIYLTSSFCYIFLQLHCITKFGVAAHWDYKRQNKAMKALPEKPLSNGNTTLLALLSAGNTMGKSAGIIESTSVRVELNNNINITNILLENSSSSRVSQKGRFASYIDALVSLHEKIVQNNMFVFLA